MGAFNSKSHTAHILNPDQSSEPMEPVVTVSPMVLKRLEKSQKQSDSIDAKDKAKMEQDHQRTKCPKCSGGNAFNGSIKQSNSLLQAKSNELEESQFIKTLEKLEVMLGKPISWTENLQEDISELRKTLIKCHQEYREEPLRCSDAAKQYQNFVFSEQFKSILKYKDIKIERVKNEAPS